MSSGELRNGPLSGASPYGEATLNASRQQDLSTRLSTLQESGIRQNHQLPSGRGCGKVAISVGAPKGDLRVKEKGVGVEMGVD
jgi:hypothetical protein